MAGGATRRASAALRVSWTTRCATPSWISGSGAFGTPSASKARGRVDGEARRVGEVDRGRGHPPPQPPAERAAALRIGESAEGQGARASRAGRPPRGARAPPGGSPARGAPARRRGSPWPRPAPPWPPASRSAAARRGGGGQAGAARRGDRGHVHLRVGHAVARRDARGWRRSPSATSAAVQTPWASAPSAAQRSNAAAERGGRQRGVEGGGLRVVAVVGARGRRLGQPRERAGARRARGGARPPRRPARAQEARPSASERLVAASAVWPVAHHAQRHRQVVDRTWPASARDRAKRSEQRALARGGGLRRLDPSGQRGQRPGGHVEHRLARAGRGAHRHATPTSTSRKRAGAVPCETLHELPRLALAAVHDAPQPPRRGRAHRVEPRPELRRHAGVARVAQHATQRAVRGSPRRPRSRTGSAAGASRSTTSGWSPSGSPRRCRRSGPRACPPRRARGARWSCARAAGARSPAARMQPPERSSPICAADSREERKPRSTPSRTIGDGLRGHPLVVPAEGAEAARRGGVGGDVHQPASRSAGGRGRAARGSSCPRRRPRCRARGRARPRDRPTRGAAGRAARRRARAWSARRGTAGAESSATASSATRGAWRGELERAEVLVAGLGHVAAGRRPGSERIWGSRRPPPRRRCRRRTPWWLGQAGPLGRGERRAPRGRPGSARRGRRSAASRAHRLVGGHQQVELVLERDRERVAPPAPAWCSPRAGGSGASGARGRARLGRGHGERARAARPRPPRGRSRGAAAKPHAAADPHAHAEALLGSALVTASTPPLRVETRSASERT